jgi:hypothetical protein
MSKLKVRDFFLNGLISVIEKITPPLSIYLMSQDALICPVCARLSMMLDP